MYKVIKVTPFFSERLWGGHKLKDFGFQLPTNDLYGEAWVISALDNGMSYIATGPEQGTSLKSFYKNHPEYFGTTESEFPLLSKIITANDYLSVQVHPDDEYSLKHNKMLGKPECWYILDCPSDATMIYGHQAQTKTELITMVEQKVWEQLFTKVKVKKGDFLYVPPGKVHAITPRVTVFELQRSSDVTYRFYDFNRADKDGNLRPLHLQECFDVTTVPDSNEQVQHIIEGILVDNQYFTLHLLTKTQVLDLSLVQWGKVTVVEGEITIGTETLKAGESAIIVDLNQKITVKVNGKALLSYKK
ncbi:MAG: mannose-6-phosphate isomerase [Spiroplasma poulsonii]|uniref:Putative mannose-6-phosphate isomerase YvyI n=1 Tax=Spiroplasma poulsonii TaxID=2138 RepID=A0A2P6FG18_9MOLU|nr:type I phosphomannose isomerase catalytic subunit [Spiroplasma poulsonii]KAF0849890.1 putative mannose-6-phosphate isomerase YvyI [Spiroplasma poulsonii]MBW1241733.1 mannose-6-phosphate isomerase [Spiroplasma poulsonii]PQM32383.1 putative mannose-6-phosphate isomerase YvyI [Spiroplasma poulsonii]PWF95042.1 Putative mannose-6-phosphate isomerase YvyI [Spiroplasma poulsonii]PWF97835.1 Putative mannose-6-phosphate isomerase YvyI [Spiroplasma poulsonii]